MERFIESSFTQEDAILDIPLRPSKLSEFVGQDQLVEQLEILIGAAKLRKEALGHCLFCGPPGLGKTTLSNIIANAMESELISTSGPILEKPADLAGILTKMRDGDIFFIDEIHRLNKVVEEYLYSAMEDYSLDIVIDSGANARTVAVKLARFTLVGATTKLGLLSAPLRSRFAFTGRLDYYTPEVLEKIIERSSRIMGIAIDKQTKAEIALRSRGTPRIANHLLRWVRDYAQMKNANTITKESAEKALDLLSIDNLGLDDMDLKILQVIIENYKGGPVGLQTIAVAVGEESNTIEDVYEPFLIQQGLLKRTPRGREATAFAFEHFSKRLLRKRG